MPLFSVTCTTCRAKLSVKNVAALGQILGCPKCGGMVQVVAPPGWQPPTEKSPSETPGSQTSGLKMEESGTAVQAGASKPAPTAPPIASKPSVWSDEPTDATGLSSTMAAAGSVTPGKVGRGVVFKGTIAAGVASLLLLSSWGFYHWSRLSPESIVAPADSEVAKADPISPAATKVEPTISITETEMVTLEKAAIPADSSRLSPSPASPSPQENPSSAPQVAGNPAVITVTAPPSVQPTTPQPAPSQTTASAPAATTSDQPAVPAKTDPRAQVATSAPVAEPKQTTPAGSVQAASVASNSPLPEPQRLPLRDDIAARLADKLPEIELREIPLVQALRILSQLSNLPVTLDLDAFAENHLDLESRVSIKMNDATVADILAALLAQHRLEYVVEEDQVLATSSQRRHETETRKTEQYSVLDLTGLEPHAVSDIVRRIVAPSTWHQAGGRGTVQVSGSNLVIEQSSAVHRQLQTFLDRLRLARGKSISTPVAGQSDFSSRVAPARNKLSQTLSANFHEETPLARILEYLEQVTGLRIVIDLPALAHEGIASDAPFNLTADRQPLSTALAALLEPRGLTYRIHNDRTLQVTSFRAARQRLDVEVYKIADLVTPAISVEGIVERIKAQASPATWRESGGPGLIVVDASAPCLIVLQSQGVHLQLQELLDRSRAASRQIKP
jgi:hypothetical protein